MPIGTVQRRPRRTDGALGSLRGILTRHRRACTVVCSLAVAAALGIILFGRRHDFSVALERASIGTLIVAAVLQLVALLARTEAWHLTIGHAGGTARRRLLYRASSVGPFGSMLNSQVGAAARITALRRSCPATTPCVATLVAAEVPIVTIEAGLAALASFTLIGPLGLPWWLPIPIVGVIGLLAVGVPRLAHRSARPAWRGLDVLRDLRGARSVLAFVLVAVVAQIMRNWLLLNAVGVPATPFDATAVLIAMVTLSMLPIGPSVGASAVVLILGHDGVAAAAAAGILATATGTVGGLSFAGWGAADRLWTGRLAPAA